MYQIITHKMLRYIAIFPALIFLSLLMADWPQSLFSKLSLTGLATALVATLLGSGWGPWRWAWRRWPKLNQWIYPDLNGVWQGSLKSNWPVIERMAKAAKGEAQPFDPFGTAEADSTELKDVPMTIRIRADWFRIRVTLDHTGYSDSETLCVAPIRSKDGKPHVLTYIYKNRTQDPRATDTNFHDGAALLEARLDEHLRLEGSVWTERKWRQGANTAGLLILTRVSHDPDAKVAGPATCP